ncbi:MAG: hypothetical protein ABIX00_11825 [Polaromonas sp.]
MGSFAAPGFRNSMCGPGNPPIELLTTSFVVTNYDFKEVILLSLLSRQVGADGRHGQPVCHPLQEVLKDQSGARFYEVY